MGRGGVIALKAPRKMQPIAPKRCPISTVVVLPALHSVYKCTPCLINRQQAVEALGRRGADAKEELLRSYKNYF
jgi:hypothetical protein